MTDAVVQITEKKYTGKLNEAALVALLQKDSIIANLDETKIAKIESDFQSLFEKDDASCEEWRKDAKDLLDMARLKDKKRDHIQEWQSDLQLPDLIFSAMQFNARTYPEYIKAAKVCQPKVIGRFTEDKMARAVRVCTHINWQLSTEIVEWASNFDKLLLLLPIIGHVFKLTMWDDQLGRITDTLLLPDQVTVDNYENSPDWHRRIGIDIVVNKNALLSLQASKKWRQVEIECSDGTEEDPKYSMVQIHAWVDLDDDEYQEPYILTFNKSDFKLMSIVPRFDIDSLMYLYDPKDPEKTRELIGIEAVNYITSYEYCPSPDGRALGMGLGHVIQGMTRARNSSINQIQDAGTLMNLGGGWVKKGTFRDDGTQFFTPGQYKVTDALTDAEDLSKSFFKLPVEEPATATYNVLNTLGDFVSRIASTGEIMSGDSAPANMPATSVLAIIQQGKMGTTAVLTRINTALTKELGVIYRLNKAYLTNSKNLAVGDYEDVLVANDYNTKDFDIQPIADPNLSTKSERLMQHKAAMEIGIESPTLIELYLIDLGYDDKMAKQLAEGWGQMKQMAAQANAQMELLKQQEQTLKQQRDASDAEERRLKAQMELLKAQTDAKVKDADAKLKMANALKAMAEVESVRTTTQITQSNALLEQVAQLPPAIPTIEELNDEQTGQQANDSGVPAMAGQPDNNGGDAAIGEGASGGEQPNELPVGLGEAEPTQGASTGVGDDTGHGELEAGGLQEGE